LLALIPLFHDITGVFTGSDLPMNDHLITMMPCEKMESCKMPIEEGKAAPLFTLKDQNGNKVALKDHTGKDVIVFFYPKDDTPGCTKEACGFRDQWAAFKKAGVVVLGVSPDGEESHQKFISKYDLPFTLLSDPDKKVMEKYGAWGEKMMYGKKVTGVIRSTVWVGPNGKVKKHWRKVPKAADHPEKVLQAMQNDA
jgi:peroxiredoxin Q/BCP